MLDHRPKRNSPTCSPPTTWQSHPAALFRAKVEDVCRLLQEVQFTLRLMAESEPKTVPGSSDVTSDADALETLSLAQAQQLLQVSRSTLYALLNTGAIAWTRVGARRRILRTTLLD